MKRIENLLLQVCLFSFFSFFVLCQESQNFSLRKCHCKLNEAEDSIDPQKCVLNSNLKFQFWINNSVVNNLASDLDSESVVVQPLSCSMGFNKDTLFERFYLDLEGYIHVYPFEKTKNYCIENVVEDDQFIAQKLEICTPIMAVPICCELNETYDNIDGCVPVEGNPEDILNSVGWINQNHTTIQKLDCLGNNSTNSMIVQRIPADSAFMDVLTYYQTQYQDPFCFAIHSEATGFNSYVHSCHMDQRGSKGLDESSVSVPYCCPVDEAFINEECRPHTENFSIPLSIRAPSSINEVKGSFKCDVGSIGPISLDDGVEYTILSSGDLLTNNGVNNSTIMFNHYCLGHILGPEGNAPGIVCYLDESLSLRTNLVRFKVYTVLLSISCIFIILTLIVYLGIPDLRRRIGGFCLISELFALLISYTTITIIFNRDETQIPNEDACLAAGVIISIFTLASFFWLNVMCYDVWSTFRKLRPFSEKISKTKVMVKYSLYAWGIPLLIGIILVIVEKLEAPLRPHFTPLENCYFNSNAHTGTQWLYMYGWVLILLLINLGFFVHLAIIMKPCQPDRKKLFQQRAGKETDASKLPDAENVKLYAKLFIIMGLPWIIELISSIPDADNYPNLWIIDIPNALRGVMIFFIFVCKQTTRKQIISTWFPSWEKKREMNSDSSQERSRKTSMLSISSWLPTRKVSKCSAGSGNNIQMQEAIGNTNPNPDNQANNDP